MRKVKCSHSESCSKSSMCLHKKSHNKSFTCAEICPMYPAAKCISVSESKDRK